MTFYFSNSIALTVKEEQDSSADTRQAEQRQHGIYYDDDYDYMQHVRDRSDEGAIVWEAANPTRAGSLAYIMMIFIIMGT